MQETQKPQLTNSMLDMMCRCGIQFQRRYGARFGCWHTEEIIPPGIALATGISVHKSVEANFKFKMADSEHRMLEPEEVEGVARDEFENIWQAGLLLTDDEAANLDNLYGSSIDMTVKLARLHYDNLAPHILPVAVEEPFVINLNGYPYDLAGRKDIRTEKGIHDVKTKSVTPPDDAARSMQMAMYAMSEKIERGKLPDLVELDFLIKTKMPKIVIRMAKPSDAWIQPLLRRIEQMTKIILAVKEGHIGFTPADPENWVCSKRYCGFSRTCSFWSGK